ncbi:hypothetical protein [Escherichia coli]|uniref:hypothetical protein n=1 Tax=Escherichia coli TaxID=562 RepID=UPI001CA701D7|nr:hypothetical protein [Escherichia coli]QZY67688.1 hypothetical protein K7X33_16470 [Escherichia coli]
MKRVHVLSIAVIAGWMVGVMTPTSAHAAENVQPVSQMQIQSMQYKIAESFVKWEQLEGLPIDNLGGAIIHELGEQTKMVDADAVNAVNHGDTCEQFQELASTVENGRYSQIEARMKSDASRNAYTKFKDQKIAYAGLECHFLKGE